MSDDVNSPRKWDADYARGTDGWDLGRPTPALQRLASSGLLMPGRMMVLGAGRGHDAREFARHGFQVTAVDFAPHAVREMQRLADPHAPIDILQHDIFTLPVDLNHTFDYVLEYTCFCAIDPDRRGDYADLVTRLLKPGGRYIDLAFPIGDHPGGRREASIPTGDLSAAPAHPGSDVMPEPGGPPFAVSVPEIVGLFEARGFKLTHRETPADSPPQRRGLEALLIFQAP